MEKRLFTAILLSLLVLYLWVGLTQPERQGQRGGLETVENKEVVGASSSPYLEQPAPPPAVFPSEAKEIVIENQKLRVTLSSKGAAIKDVYIKDYGTSLPVQNIGIPQYLLGMDFEVALQSDLAASFSYRGDGLDATIQYVLTQDGYHLNQDISMVGEKMSKLDKVQITAMTLNMSRMDIKDEEFNRDKGLFEYVVNSYSGTLRKNNAYKFEEKEEKDIRGHVVWAGFRDRYYCAIYRPQYDSAGYEVNSVDDNELNLRINTASAGDNIKLSSLIFIGPEKLDVLKSYNLDLEKIKRFYRFPLFDIIAMIIYQLMHWIYRLIPNWGVAIILISSILYFSMYPLTLRGMSSMKRMQAIQPEISKLKEKYSDNPQKMNQEMMRLYKEYKINPLGGCLPFLLQMPIFIGLYQVLWRSVTFKGADFLWIKDLSLPDRFYILPVSLPFIEREINLLPILMMIIMFVQQRVTAKNMTLSDPMQIQQQKMMGIFMPILLGIIFYKFASGLTLYFTVFYLFSTFTQMHMYAKKAEK